MMKLASRRFALFIRPFGKKSRNKRMVFLFILAVCFLGYGFRQIFNSYSDGRGVEPPVSHRPASAPQANSLHHHQQHHLTHDPVSAGSNADLGVVAGTVSANTAAGATGDSYYDDGDVVVDDGVYATDDGCVTQQTAAVLLLTTAARASSKRASAIPKAGAMSKLESLLRSVDFSFDSVGIDSERLIWTLENSNKVYRVIVVESYVHYLHMNRLRRQMIDAYCQRSGCGIIGLLPVNRRLMPLDGQPLHLFADLYAQSVSQVKNIVVNASSPLLRIVKSNGIWQPALPGGEQIVLVQKHASRWRNCAHSVVSLVNTDHSSPAASAAALSDHHQQQQQYSGAQLSSDDTVRSLFWHDGCGIDGSTVYTREAAGTDTTNTTNNINKGPVNGAYGSQQQQLPAPESLSMTATRGSGGGGRGGQRRRGGVALVGGDASLRLWLLRLLLLDAIDYLNGGQRERRSGGQREGRSGDSLTPTTSPPPSAAPEAGQSASVGGDSGGSGRRRGYSGAGGCSEDGGGLRLSLTRYLQVDVDDVFIASPLANFTSADVQAMLSFQRLLRRHVPGFTFNLGYCGAFFNKSGGPADHAAHRALIENAAHFWWFPHTWHHTQPHRLSTDQLAQQLVLNKQFAERYSLPVLHQYSVTPHHSAIYPVYNALYDTWTKVWNIRQTSTEQYPHLHMTDGSRRRGFVHRGIRVVPRQTCAIFTRNVHLSDYHNGQSGLDAEIEGGSVFWSFVTNPVLVLMTHQPNYAGDRLALYLLRRLVLFLADWTNLQLAARTPDKMADIYFQLFPEQQQPVWGNPCHDKRHLQIWRLPVVYSSIVDDNNNNNSDTTAVATSKSASPHTAAAVLSAADAAAAVCRSLSAPTAAAAGGGGGAAGGVVVIVGPQKTGSTALYQFMAWHRVIANSSSRGGGSSSSSSISRGGGSVVLRPAKWQPDTYEELQFFSGRRYHDGVDWYISQFMFSDSDSGSYVPFEKSATYFDSEVAPRRMAALLPNAKLVILLQEPASRAHSWFHHQRAHRDPAALTNTFWRVLTSSHSSTSTSTNSSSSVQRRDLVRLRDRCLRPGKYSEHITHWLQHYHVSQMHFVDSDLLRTKPAQVMADLQTFVGVSPVIDYSKYLTFDKRKGFFCLFNPASGVKKCLGKSKGRHYPAIQPEAQQYLMRYYADHNAALYRQLLKLGLAIPAWLRRFVDGF